MMGYDDIHHLRYGDCMKKGSTAFLKSVIILLGAAVIAGLVTFPLFEGRNIGKDLLYIYVRDPALLYIYATSLPFFTALAQAFKLLGYIEKNEAFSLKSVRVLTNIKYCAVLIGILVMIAVPRIIIIGETDDSPGIVVIVAVISFASFVIATFAAVLQKLIQNAVDLKSENDLTV